MTSARSRRGGLARRSGRRGEVLAALLLMLKGYRILGFRLASPQGEIDLLALKGGILAVVEVKRRTSLETALEAVRADQRLRLPVVHPVKGQPTQHHPARGPRKQPPDMQPFRVPPIGRRRHDIAEAQQRQHRARGLLCRHHHREKDHRETPQPADAGFGNPHDQRRQHAERPLPWLQRHAPASVLVAFSVNAPSAT